MEIKLLGELVMLLSCEKRSERRKVRESRARPLPYEIKIDNYSLSSGSGLIASSLKT